MDYRKTAQEIYDHVGKKANIISAAHCATRLRLVIADNDKADKEYVENIDGVKGVFFAQGQMQIILGTGVVNKVYDEFIQIAGVSESSKEELKQVAASKANPAQRLIKTLGDIFVPIIPAIVASGFLMGIMEALNFMVNNGFLNINTNGSIYVFAQLFSNTAYTFLPILIAALALSDGFYSAVELLYLFGDGFELIFVLLHIGASLNAVADHFQHPAVQGIDSPFQQVDLIRAAVGADSFADCGFHQG